MGNATSLLWRIARITTAAGAALSAAAAAGCGAATPPGAGLAPRTTSAVHRPASFGPLDATFISRLAGWMLGMSRTSHPRIELYRTADGGRRWTAVPVPAVPWEWAADTVPADAVSRVTFADARNGWLYGPGLWATHDGGTSWRRIGTHGAQVDSLQAVDGQVLAAFTTCAGQCGFGNARFTVYRSPAAGDYWHLVIGATGPGFGQLALAGSSGYAVGNAGMSSRATMVTGPASGPGPWLRRPLPCPSAWQPVIAASAAGLALACNQPQGEHPVRVLMYTSADGGLRWHRDTGLYLEDGADGISVAPDGMTIVAGIYSGMVISLDGRRAWHAVPPVDDTDDVQGGGSFRAAMVTNRFGFAIVQTLRAWLTRDGGRTWTAVTVR
jgi:photosystem II stability/assembly factor-like uncharacterized protein